VLSVAAVAGLTYSEPWLTPLPVAVALSVPMLGKLPALITAEINVRIGGIGPGERAMVISLGARPAARLTLSGRATG